MNRGWSRGCKPLREANMIEGLETLLEGKDQPGLTEVRELLQELLAGQDGTGRLLDQQSLKRRTQGVYRLRFAIDGHTRSVVIKRLEPEIARRNELVARRWLPAVGLDGSGPPLLGSVAARSGRRRWPNWADQRLCCTATCGQSTSSSFPAPRARARGSSTGTTRRSARPPTISRHFCCVSPRSTGRGCSSVIVGLWRGPVGG